MLDEIDYQGRKKEWKMARWTMFVDGVREVCEW